MSDRLALTLGAAILTATVLNFALGLGLHIAVGKLLFVTIHWLAFWR